MQPQQPVQPVPPQPRRGLHPAAIAGIVGGVVLVLCCGAAVAFGIGLGPETDAPGRVADGTAAVESPSGLARGGQARERSPSPSPSPQESPEPAVLTIPEDLVGQNAAIVDDRLRDLGFTDVQYASADEDDTFVLLLANWTVVEVEPAGGSEVGADSVVVVTCTKG